MQPINDNTKPNLKKDIAIIGSGIAGLSLALGLIAHMNVTLYEEEDRLGGHSRTINVKYDDKTTFNVDTGFIVLNDRTYPNLQALFRYLDVPCSKSDMSFSLSSNEGELEWAGHSLGTWFAQRKNVLNVGMWRGLFDVLKFNKTAKSIVDKDPTMSLGDLKKKSLFNEWFWKYYLLPMGGAIWSCDVDRMLSFPAKTFIDFFYNHGLLSINNRPQWYTPTHKSIDYVEKIQNKIHSIAHKAQTTFRVETNARIKKIIQEEGGAIRLVHASAQSDIKNMVMFACHGQVALSLLDNPSLEQKNILSRFHREKNIAYTHKDDRFMPKRKQCWASWNYLRVGQSNHKQSDNTTSKVCLTYWMNNLQHILPQHPTFVTLNPIKPIDETKIFDEKVFYHPSYTWESVSAQKDIHTIQGVNNMFFCGAYLGYGFHEDGIKSSVHIMEKLGIQAPWL